MIELLNFGDANRTCRVLVHATIENKFKRYDGKLSHHEHLPDPSASEVRNLQEKNAKEN